MKCPRCGENLYGSVCPKCGNVVVTNRTAVTRNTVRTSARTGSNNGNVKFMDSNTRPVKPAKKKSAPANQLLKLIIVVLAVICVFLFFKYRSVSAKLAEAESTITTLNDTIKVKDEEIAQLNTPVEEPAEDENSDDSAPSVEFDENGNLVNISEDGGSSDNSDEDSDQTEYKSGDTYTVKDGDTGSSICKKVYGEYTADLWEKLLSANGMTTSSVFYPGDELKIP